MSSCAPVPTLQPDERADLLSLLAGAARPLADVVSDFLARFPRERRLRVGGALCFLLEDKKMLHPTGRLIAFAILHQSYSPQTANPYIPMLLDGACDETSDKSERAFVQLLLTSSSGNNNNEVLNQSAVDYINGSVSASQVLLPREQLEKQYCSNGVQSQPQISSFRPAAVRSVIPDPDVPQSCANSSESAISLPGSKQKSSSDDRDSALAGLLQEKSGGRLGPQWIRPTPPRLPVLDGELQWLNPDNNHELLWDYSMCADTSRGAAIRDLIARALKGPLAPAQQERFIIELANDPKLVYYCGMTPQKLPDLVEHNPLIAVEVLSKLINSPDISGYFAGLVHMDMSLHSMEVVNRLTTAVDLPTEFVHEYITNCIQSCQNIKVCSFDSFN
ncbi:hypothetical protein PVAP13_3KG061500 [Panicum virgatum]|uniref:CCR4-NOT transcription complex subunit 11 n=1 Tax=Panicum virgatum TaxID=38727 RepID=A0A8T0UFL6_PANVG|nr:hypothetical protein PVAP13_3KG061500 [Panicum virgatum]KAG2623455.1 hypothetical protein PVAP13_3KG061500 [Panicum virgatum]